MQSSSQQVNDRGREMCSGSTLSHTNHGHRDDVSFVCLMTPLTTQTMASFVSVEQILLGIKENDPAFGDGGSQSYEPGNQWYATVKETNNGGGNVKLDVSIDGNSDFEVPYQTFWASIAASRNIQIENGGSVQLKIAIQSDIAYSFSYEDDDGLSGCWEGMSFNTQLGYTLNGLTYTILNHNWVNFSDISDKKESDSYPESLNKLSDQTTGGYDTYQESIWLKNTAAINSDGGNYNAHKNEVIIYNDNFTFYFWYEQPTVEQPTDD